MEAKQYLWLLWHHQTNTELMFLSQSNTKNIEDWVMDRYLSLKMFLQESLSNYKSPHKTGFAILHAIIAVELALKERLYIIHPELIYEDIDSQKKNKITLKLLKLPIRLENFGVSLTENDRELIRDIANWRNDLVHNIPTHKTNIARARKEIGKLYDFLFTFLSSELNKTITDIMPSSEISQMKSIINEANLLIEDSKRKAIQNSGQKYPHPCNECHEKFVIGESGNTIFCFLCNEAKQEQYCRDCEQPLYFYASINSEECICSECIEDAGDQYISWLIDNSRGK